MKKGHSVKLRNSVAYQLLKIVFAIYFFISISITLGHMFMEYLSAKEMVVDELVLLQKAFEDGLSTSLFDLNNEQLNSIVDGMYNVPVLVGIKIDPVNPNIPVTPIAIGAVIGPDGKREMIDPKEKSRFSSAPVSGLIAHSFDIYQPDSLVKIARGTLYSSERIIFSKVKDGFIRIILSAIVKTLCLWFLFLWAAHGRLSQPLRQMAHEVSRLDLKHLEGVKINVRAKAGSELKILEESFNEMIRNSSRLTRSIVDSARKYRKIFENASEGLFQISTAGSVISANPAMAKMLGYSRPDEMISNVSNFGRQCYVNPSDHAEFTAMIRKAHKVTGVEYRFKRRDGSALWCVASGQEVHGPEGRLLYYEGSLMDITEQKEKTKAEKARIVAEEASRSKSEFLANMSHEIRTPMNAVIGLAHLVQKTELTPKQRDYLRKIESSGLSLLGIINDILDFSKIEANKLSMESIDFDLQSVFDNVVDLINMKAEEKGLELLFDVGRDVPHGLVGDPLRLGQILINLAGNSIKFTQSGQVLIKAERAEKQSDAAKIWLKFSVSDSGIGLTPEQISNLFRSFSQADGSTTRKYGGTGLGLSISKRLVEMMGGEIGVDSAYGEGSTFSFTAGFGVQTGEPQKPLISPGELHGMRVLVVDDNAKSREILRDLMEEFHFTVSEAGSGEAAISTLKQGGGNVSYDLVLMDWQMNGIDGIETARRIREDSGLERVPAILMVTAYGREEIMSQAKRAGLDGFLIKPVNRSLLFDTIMNLFGKTGVIEHAVLSRKPEEILEISVISGTRILLVEDNNINQQVATELLQNAGVIVTVAGNGREAVDAVAKADQEFDGVLMDIQMPELDGYEATRRIRRDPAHAGLPIIAMTANAMAGDREKCLDAGMNDHIPKPIEPGILFETLAKWLPGTGAPSPGRPKSLEKPARDGLPDHLDGIDLETGLRRTGDNPAFYRRLLRDFLTRHGNDTDLIRSACDQQDTDLAVRLVHTLKGIAGSIGATHLYDAARTLELSIKETPDEVPRLVKNVEKELGRVVDGLSPHIKEEKPLSGSPGQPLAAGTVETLVAEIEKLINEMNPDAEEKAEALCGIVGQTGAEPFRLAETLAAQTGDFDFDAAFETLGTLKDLLQLNVRPASG